MRKIPLYISFLLLLISCKKEPNIITREEYRSKNAKLYYQYSNSKQYYPEEIAVTLNDSVLILSVVNSFPDYFHFSICVNKTHVDSTILSSTNENNWGRSKTSESSSLVRTTHNTEVTDFNFFVINEIDEDNSTISGHFKIHGREGYFRQLKYSNEFSSRHILYSAKINIGAKALYKTQIFDFSRTSSNLNVHLANGGYLKFNNYSFDTGINNWDTEQKIYYYPNNTYYPYYGQTGDFYVTSFEMFGHTYTKVEINGVLKQNTYSSESLAISNSELILY